MHHDTARALDSGSYAARLLSELGFRARRLPRPATHPALRWAECGAMSLTGQADGAAKMCPVPLASCADGALSALQAVAAAPDGVLPAGGELLGERAALAGLTRRGRVAPGGACRLLDCVDGRVAVSLARSHDWASVPAWLEADIRPEAALPGDATGAAGLAATHAAWDAVASAVAARKVDELVERGRILALAVAAERLDDAPAPPWFEIDCEDLHAANRRREQPLVMDLSSLWAGPLCTHLLGLLGAQVIKVESIARPDGARAGDSAFNDLLNADKASVALDLRSADDRDLLERLLAAADIIVEASRPRALAQLGIDAAGHCLAGRSLTWISLTGHGRRRPHDEWVAFGDDAAVAAGLTTVMRHATGDTLFCGDAIADPLAGMHAALAAWWSHRRGGARRISLSLSGVVRHCLDFGAPLDEGTLRERQQDWTSELARARVGPRPAVARAPRGTARPLGADTAVIAARFAPLRLSSSGRPVSPASC